MNSYTYSATKKTTFEVVISITREDKDVAGDYKCSAIWSGGTFFSTLATVTTSGKQTLKNH
jgi:hypothetical protein